MSSLPSKYRFGLIGLEKEEEGLNSCVCSCLIMIFGLLLELIELSSINKVSLV